MFAAIIPQVATIRDIVNDRCSELGIHLDGLSYQLDMQPEVLMTYLLAPGQAPEGFWEGVALALGWTTRRSATELWNRLGLFLPAP